jgi:hypothetical protein
MTRWILTRAIIAVVVAEEGLHFQEVAEAE